MYMRGFFVFREDQDGWNHDSTELVEVRCTRMDTDGKATAEVLRSPRQTPRREFEKHCRDMGFQPMLAA